MESYRPLSFLAGARCAWRLYAAIVVIGTASALFTHSPLLLPAWLFIVPAGSLLLAWMARAQIQNSEGALSGLALTQWSIRLNIVFALAYGAYYAATGLAVRQQGDHFARRWLEEIKKGEIYQALRDAPGGTQGLQGARTAADARSTQHWRGL